MKTYEKRASKPEACADEGERLGGLPLAAVAAIGETVPVECAAAADLVDPVDEGGEGGEPREAEEEVERVVEEVPGEGQEPDQAEESGDSGDDLKCESVFLWAVRSEGSLPRCRFHGQWGRCGHCDGTGR